MCFAVDFGLFLMIQIANLTGLVPGNGTSFGNKCLRELGETAENTKISRLSFPATDPPDPRRVSEGVQKGSQKGFRRVSEGF